MTISTTNWTPVTTGQHIRSAREAHGYTVDDLAETCGLTTKEIEAIETDSDIDPVRIRRVTTALRIDQSMLG